MNKQNINRKQLEKAVQKKRMQLAKTKGESVAPIAPPEPEPIQLTTFLAPPVPKTTKRPKEKPRKTENASLADLEKKHFNYGNWEWYTTYRLMPVILIWAFLQPQRFLIYKKLADLKHERILKATVDTTCVMIVFSILMMPFLSVFLGLSRLLEHGIELEKWFIGLIGIIIINLLSVPFHMLVNDSELILVQFFRFFIRYFTGSFTLGIVYVVMGGIVGRSHDEFFFVLLIFSVISLILGGLVWAVGADYKPMRFFQQFERWIANIAQSLVGDAIEEGEPTLKSISFFLIIVIIYGIFLWIYFFNGWQNFCECPINFARYY